MLPLLMQFTALEITLKLFDSSAVWVFFFLIFLLKEHQPMWKDEARDFFFFT